MGEEKKSHQDKSRISVAFYLIWELIGEIIDVLFST